MRSLENNSFRFIKDNYLRTIVITIVLGLFSLSLIYIDSTKKIYSDSRSNVRDVILAISSTIATPAILLEQGFSSINKINNLLYINPGACGKVGFHKRKTIVRFCIEKGKIDKLEVVELS